MHIWCYFLEINIKPWAWIRSKEMNIGSIKIWPTKGQTSLKANGIVTLSDVLNVKFAIVNGSNGMFVSFPQKVVKTDGETKYYPEVSFPKSEEADKFRGQLTKEILNAYSKATGASDNMNQGEASGPDSQLPF